MRILGQTKRIKRAGHQKALRNNNINRILKQILKRRKHPRHIPAVQGYVK
jgi:hypothetical protein